MKPPTKHSRQDGIVGVVLLAAVVPLLILSGAILQTLATQSKEIEQQEHLDTAELISVSGAQDGLARLATDSAFRGRFRLNTNGGVAIVTVTQWDTDGLDNDGNGTIDDANEAELVGVVSVGYLNALLDINDQPVARAVQFYRHTSRAVAHRDIINLNMPQAVYLDDPFAIVDINGDAFLVSGDDTNPDGTPGNGASLPAIGVPGDPNFIIDQILANQHDNFTGEGGDPSISEVEPLDISEYIEALAASATMVFSDPDASLSSAELGDVDAGVQEVVYAHGNLTIGGNSTGTGIILVEGDLEIDGSFDYQGVLIVGGSITFRGGGNKTIHGAMATLGSVENASGGLEVSGAVSLLYSSQVLAAVASLAGRYSLATWLP